MTVYNRLMQGHFTPVYNVAINLRNQRALAFENIAQYSYVYVAVVEYIKSKTGSTRWSEAMKHLGQWGPELAKFVDITSSHL